MAHNFLPGLLSPFPRHWLPAPTSDFAFVLQEAERMLVRFPHLLPLIEADLDKGALAKKTQRLKDRQARFQQHPQLPGIPDMATPVGAGVDDLAEGRPRMSPRCYLFLVIRGYLGSVKSLEARDFLSESLSLRLFLAQEEIGMPSPSTILENTNKVSQETHDALLAAQILWIKERGLDDFQEKKRKKGAVLKKSANTNDYLSVLSRGCGQQQHCISAKYAGWWHWPAKWKSKKESSSRPFKINKPTGAFFLPIQSK